MSLATAIPDGIRRLLTPQDQERSAAAQKTEADSKILAELDELYKKARDDRRQYESEWTTNLSFLKGQQWVQWNKGRQALYVPPSPPWRIRVTINLIQPVVRTMLGKLISQRSQARVQASNESAEAAQDAKAQDELLDYLWDQCDSEAESQEALKWAIITGTGLHHPCWDKSLGDEVNNPDTIEGPPDEMGQPTEQPHPQAGQPLREPGADGQENPDGNVVHMGEVDHIAVSPFQFFPEPMALKIDDMEWCFYVSIRPASYVQRKFGEKIDEGAVSSEDVLQFSTGEDQVGGQTKGVVLKEFWRRKSAEHPDGQYVVYADDKILANLPNPYLKLQLPFIAVRDATVPGRFWGRSVVSDLVPLQRSYNKLKSQAAEIRESTARPKWHVFENALIPGKPITTAPAEVIITRVVPGAPNGGAPTKIMGGDVPASFQTEAAAIQAQFFEIAGIHDFSRGMQGLGGARAGYIVQMLLEEDGTRMGVLKGSFDRSIVELEEAKLTLAKQYYIEPRMIHILGADSTAEVKQFDADKINDDVRVHIIASGALPTSWAAKQQLILEFRKEGLVPDDNDARKLMGLADVHGMFDKATVDIRQAQRENEAMKAGSVPEAHDYDNHQTHGQEHDGYRKGQEFEQLSTQNPAIAQAFAQHMEMHKQLIQAAMAGQVIPPKVSLTGKLTPQQEAQEFGAPAAPAPAPKAGRMGQVAMPLSPSTLPKGPLDLRRLT